MVGIMAANTREKVASLVNLAKFAMDIPSKLELLRPLKEELSLADSVLLADLLPLVIDLHTDRFSPVRKFITEYALLSPIRIHTLMMRIFVYNSVIHIGFLSYCGYILLSKLSWNSPFVFLGSWVSSEKSKF